jgi:hypothetical protein
MRCFRACRDSCDALHAVSSSPTLVFRRLWRNGNRARVGVSLVGRTATGKSLELLLLILQRLCQHAPRSPHGATVLVYVCSTPVGPQDARSLTYRWSRFLPQNCFRHICIYFIRLQGRPLCFRKVRASRGTLFMTRFLGLPKISYCPQRIRVKPKIRRRRHAIHAMSLTEPRNATEMRSVHVGTVTISSDTSRDCLPKEYLTKISK